MLNIKYMKKTYLLLAFISLLFLFNSCSKDDEIQKPTTTDISVSTSENLIYWIDDNDLTQKLNNILSYNYGEALENEVEKKLNFNPDSTEVIATINFKQEFQNKYFDSNIANNTTTIELLKESEIPIDSDIMSALTFDQQCELVQTLIDDLPNFSLNTKPFVCVPITFHIPSAISISQIDLDMVITNLNSNFFDSKILFQIEEINTTSNSTYYNLVVDNVSFDEDVVNTLNVYVAHTIEENGNNLNGLAHFPIEAIDRIYIRDVYFNSNRDSQSAVLSHEIGHFFSLFHTFETAIDNFSCNTNNALSGDGINDTPVDTFGPCATGIACAASHYGLICNAINPNIEELIDNFMSYSINVYTLRNCDRDFTTQQHTRMGFAARQWKQNLSCQDNSNQSAISLSNDLDFGNVQINTTSSSQNLTISNTGNESFNITNISSSNTAFEIFGSSSVVQPNSDIDIQIRFNPTQEQTYDGVITVENTADNANSSNSSIQVTGTGINNNTGQPNIILTNQFEIDDDTSGGSNGNDNGIPEAGEEIELSVQLQNTGNASATNVTAVLSTNDGDINITDTNETYGTITAGSTDWNTDFDFEIDANCPTKTVNFRLDITSDQGSWQQNFSLNVQGSSAGNPISITPTDGCTSSPIMQVDTEYIVNLDLATSGFQYWQPISGQSAGGNDVQGFYLSFQVPSDWSANHDVKIYDVSSNFDPVFGIKAHCNGGFLGQNDGNGGFNDYVDNNGSGRNETSDTNLPGGNNGGTPDSIYHIRIYHYDGSESPTISFKIIVE